MGWGNRIGCWISDLGFAFAGALGGSEKWRKPTFVILVSMIDLNGSEQAYIQSGH